MAEAGMAPVALRTTSGVLISGTPVKLGGFSAKALGSAIDFNLRVKNASGVIALAISLVDGQSTSDNWPKGLQFDTAVYFELVSGTGADLTGSVWVI